MTACLLFLFSGMIQLLANDETSVAQQRVTVTGTVTEKGDPLPGVTILLKNTTNGTTTDADGKYSITVPGENAVLAFSFIGYITQEIQVGAKRTIDVTLVEDAQTLEEVVVVGYGVQRKSVTTAAISSVNMKTVRPVATQRVDQMLQGRAAGVMVLNTDGSPGGNTTIRIRGMNSIQGGNNALIVVDGFQGGSLNAINPYDIESIEILKDASATAIYGAQGANGVVLITTKRGSTDKPVINYSSEVGFSKLLMGGVKLMNAADYAREMNRYEMAKNFENVPIPIFSDSEIAEFERTGGTNWIDEVYRTGVTQNHRISMSGRSSRINYYASGAIFDQQGILINSGFKRYSLKANMLADITDWFQFDLNWDLQQLNKYGAQFGNSVDWPANPIRSAFQFAPTIPVYDENGNYSKASTRYGSAVIWNPVASAKEPLNENENTSNIINLYMKFTLAKGLTLRAGAGFQIQDFNERQFNNNNTFIGSQDNGSAYTYYSKGKNIQSSNVLNYVNDWGDHHLNAVVVGEYKNSNTFSFQVNASDFAVQETSVYGLSGANIQRTSSGFSERKILSGVTRINYAFADKYIITASYRADGSSVFGANNKWASFPSVSVGWRLTQEKFMRNLDFLSNAMIRASWGKTGNQAISAYQTLSKISYLNVYPWDGGNSANLGYQISSAANPNLKWETTTQKNIGIDLALFRNRVKFTAEYYDKVTDDLLMSRELPRTTGLNSIIDNVGSMGNKGWEFSLDVDLDFGELSWTTGANLTASKTTVLDLGNTAFLSYAAGGSGHSVNIPIMFLYPGEPFGQIRGFGYEGTWKTGQEEEAGRYGQMPGDPRYTDVNNDGRIDYDNDFKVIGNALPKFIYGWNNQFRYKNWDLTFLIQGTYGNDLFNVARISREDETGYSADKLKRWTFENQNSNIPAIHTAQYRHDYVEAWNASHPDNQFINTITFPTSGGNATSRWIEDASYLRLKNVTLAYNLRFKKYISNLRIFASGTNLITITKYSGFDPEVSSYTGNDAQFGTDYNSYPVSRYFNFGIDITF